MNGDVPKIILKCCLKSNVKDAHSTQFSTYWKNVKLKTARALQSKKWHTDHNEHTLSACFPRFSASPNFAAHESRIA